MLARGKFRHHPAKQGVHRSLGSTTVSQKPPVLHKSQRCIIARTFYAETNHKQPPATMGQKNALPMQMGHDVINVFFCPNIQGNPLVKR